MKHYLVLPIVLPLLFGALLILFHQMPVILKRSLSILSAIVSLALAALIVHIADHNVISVYQLGNWPSFAGIVLVADRLSALMLVVMSVLSLFALVYASGGWDQRGPHFHALFQFQMAGLAGAFLTHDIFNLFVFFEVLLISSYGLLLHAKGDERLKRGMHYVVFNLTASALFLVGVGLLYAMVGTLNMSDLAQKIAQAPAGDVALIKAAAWILLSVFCIKAALLPVYFWLPKAYSAASAPAAVIFAIMTKVGIYAIIRVYGLLFGSEAGLLADFVWPVLLVAGLLTIVVGGLGALVAKRFRAVVAYLLISSAGFLFVAMSMNTTDALAAALFYLPHTTFAAAAMFLIADLIKRHRIHAGDYLNNIDHLQRRDALGFLYLIGAVAMGSLPPLNGFFAKLTLLSATPFDGNGAWVWLIVLVGAFLSLVALSRAASRLFWQSPESESSDALIAAPALVERGAIVGLLFILIAMSAFAQPIMNYADRAAAQLKQTDVLIETVLSKQPLINSIQEVQK